MSVTGDIAGFAAGWKADAIPAEVTDRALALAIDLAGSAVRAAVAADSSPAVLAMLGRMGLDGTGPCTVFGLDRRFGPAAAALLNGTFGHSLDFDDTHADSSLHPSAPVVPAALAAAEMTGASGADMLAAIVVGFELCCRLGMALDPAAHYARGFHPTATAGVFGAAAAAGRLLGLGAGRMESALGIAASQASGSLQFLVNGAWNKRYQVGEAAMKGLLAATLAAEGFHGASDAVAGKHGFLRGYSDGADPDKAIAGLGAVWETMRIGLKPYPACRYTHAAVDGILALMRDHRLTADAVEALEVGLHRNGITLVGSNRPSRTVVEGQFSMPFAAAVALLRGGFGWDDYELLGDPAADAIAARVTVRRDKTLEGLRHPFGATLRLQARGATHDRRIPDPSGEPETFPDPSALARKFGTLAGPVLGTGADALLDRLRALPAAPDMRHALSF